MVVWGGCVLHTGMRYRAGVVRYSLAKSASSTSIASSQRNLKPVIFSCSTKESVGVAPGDHFLGKSCLYAVRNKVRREVRDQRNPSFIGSPNGWN